VLPFTSSCPLPVLFCLFNAGLGSKPFPEANRMVPPPPRAARTLTVAAPPATDAPLKVSVKEYVDRAKSVAAQIMLLRHSRACTDPACGTTGCAGAKRIWNECHGGCSAQHESARRQIYKLLAHEDVCAQATLRAAANRASDPNLCLEPKFCLVCAMLARARRAEGEPASVPPPRLDVFRSPETPPAPPAWATPPAWAASPAGGGASGAGGGGPESPHVKRRRSVSSGDLGGDLACLADAALVHGSESPGKRRRALSLGEALQPHPTPVSPARSALSSPRGAGPGSPDAARQKLAHDGSAVNALLSLALAVRDVADRSGSA
jgi:hypothetical protein